MISLFMLNSGRERLMQWIESWGMEELSVCLRSREAGADEDDGVVPV
jgi:hypothetical protein